MQKRQVLFILMAVFLVAVVTGLFAWGGGSAPANIAPAAGQEGAPPGMPVEAQPVTLDDVTRLVEAVGTLRSNESVIIRPEIAGIITEILFDEGSAVESGQLLLRLDDSIYRAELAESQSSLVLTKANLERAQELFEKQTGTRRALDEARAAYEAAEARAALAQARLAKTKLHAPFDGEVGLRRVSAGEYVTPGQEIVNLEDLTPLKADFRVAETYLPLVKKGQAVSIAVDALSGQTFTGEVYAIDPRIDESGRSIVIRALLPNEEKLLKPGLFARVSLVIESHENVILVPEAALMPQQGSQSVYKVVDGKAELVTVQTGLRQKGMVEITGGLQPGDVVITAGQMKIQPGAPVMVLPAAGAQDNL